MKYDSEENPGQDSSGLNRSGQNRSGSSPDPNSAEPDRHVQLFDTTLRDGEQSPGATLSRDEKLEIARQLARLGVDIIEAGFPAASPDDLAAVQQIAEQVGTEDGPTVTGLARAHSADIETAWQGVQAAKKPRIHTFLATSDIHLEHKLCMSRDQVIARVGEMVAYASSLSPEVEFSPEDATRSDIGFLVEVLGVAIEAGARILNIPDTVGYAEPEEYGRLIRTLIERTPGGDGVVWSVHCHDDLGLATANTLAGLRAGARQAEVTINGIGERAGNCCLEEVVMALYTRGDRYGLRCGAHSEEITRTSRMVAQLTGMTVPPNKAIVGANAFAHEAGIHQDGMLKDQRTYEIMTPETVGLHRSRLVLGKHSGRHAFRVRLEELGLSLDGEPLQSAFRRFKDLADRKKTVTDADLEALVGDEARTTADLFQLVDLHVACGRSEIATATVKLRAPDGEDLVHAAVGYGPIHAVFQAMQPLMPVAAELDSYRVQSVGDGPDALGEVTVRLRREGEDTRRSYSGVGADIDIVVASAQAFLKAFNRLLADGAAHEASAVAEAVKVH